MNRLIGARTNSHKPQHSELNIQKSFNQKEQNRNSNFYNKINNCIIGIQNNIYKQIFKIVQVFWCRATNTKTNWDPNNRTLSTDKGASLSIKHWTISECHIPEMLGEGVEINLNEGRRHVNHFKTFSENTTYVIILYTISIHSYIYR